MKKANKILSVILAIMMMFSIIPITASAATYSGTCGDNATWTYDTSTGILTISGTGNMYDNNAPWSKYQNNIKEIVISDGVTSIGRAAFYGLTKMTSITIPESVTSIGKLAFYCCSALTSITVDANNNVYSNDEFGVLFNKDKTTLIQYPIGNTATNYIIPDSVTTVGGYAFYDCSSLADITLPDSLTIIEEWAFGNVKNITNVVFPDSIHMVGNFAFYCCSKLKDVHFGSGLEKIGKGAFQNCTSITEITIPKSVTSVGNYVFFECFSLVNITVKADNQYYSSDEYGVLYNKDKTILIQYPTAHNRIAYEIPNGVTTISEYAFSHSIHLSYITFPLSVTSIETKAFQEADNIRRIYYYGTEEQWNNIVIGDNNSDITSHTMYFECTGDEPDLGTYSDNLSYSFEYNTEDVLQSYGTLTIFGTGDMVNYDNNNQPWASYRLKTEKLVIQEGVTSIGDSAFNDFWSLTEVIIPYGVTSIGKQAFGGCDIGSITIPDSVTVIDEAFYGNYYLYDVYYTGTVSQWNDMLKNSEDTGFYHPTIHCTDGKIYPSGRCGNNVYWHFNTTTKTLTISGNGEMGNYSEKHSPTPWYIYCDDIENVVIECGVETIGEYAFYHCSNLTDVYYCGAEEQWKSISIGSSNDPLLNATIHYNYTPPFTGIKGDYLYINGVRQKAYQLVEFEGNYYFINDSHKLAKNKTLYLSERFVNGFTYEDGTPLAVGYYEFDENGKMIIKNGVVGDYFYKNNERLKAYQLVEFKGDFYFINDSHKIAKNKTLYLSERFVTGFTYEDGTPLQPGYYTFDENGKMVMLDGPVGDYFYKDNVRLKAYQLVEFEGNYYFINDSHKLAKNKRIYLSQRFVEGTDLKVGYYEFDADGKMIIE